MQTITMYLRASSVNAKNVDSYNQVTSILPSITRGMQAMLKLKLLGDDGMPLDVDFSSYIAWDFVITDDWDSETSPQIRVSENIFISDNEINIPLTSTNTEELIASLGTSESKTFGCELVGFESGETLPSYILQFDIVVRNRRSDAGTGTPTPVDDNTLSATQIYSLLQAGFEVQFSVDGLSSWHENQSDDDYYLKFRNPLHIDSQWTVPIKVFRGPQGEQGEKGDAGLDGTNIRALYSSNGSSWHETALYDDIYIKFTADDGASYSPAYLFIGSAGNSSYIYVAYASDNAGSNFSLVPTEELKYRAEIVTNATIENPTAEDFSDAVWVKYLGDNGVIVDLQIVSELPDVGEANAIYLILNSTEDGYTQYAYINENWVLVGNVDIDLSNYYTTEEIDAKNEQIEATLSNKIDLPSGGEAGQILTKTVDGTIWANTAIIGSYTSANKNLSEPFAPNFDNAPIQIFSLDSAVSENLTISDFVFNDISSIDYEKIPTVEFHIPANGNISSIILPSNVTAINIPESLNAFENSDVTYHVFKARYIELRGDDDTSTQSYQIYYQYSYPVNAPQIVATPTIFTTSLDTDIHSFYIDSDEYSSVTIDWGDGTVENAVDGLNTHTYSPIGDYTCKVYGATHISKASPFRSLVQIGNTITACTELMYGNTGLTSVADTVVISNKITTLYNMFNGCTNLTTINTGDWDTSNVKSISGLFSGCGNLTELNLSSWDTANVLDMNSLFYNCQKLTNIDISTWNVSKITSISNIFRGCIGLTSLNLSSWNMSNVTSTSYMFEGCTALTSLDVSSWDMAKVTNMWYMFKNCSSLTSLDLSSWNTASLTSLKAAFYGCSELTEIQFSSNWNTSSVTSLNSLFFNCSKLTTIDVANWDVSKVTNMEEVFYGCSQLASLDLSSWNFAQTTSMEKMFYNCTNLTTINILTLNATNVTNMTQMFRLCSNLEMDISNFFPDFSASSVNLMLIFGACSSITGTLPSELLWDNPNVIFTSSQAFYNCTSLTNYDEIPTGWK